MILDTKELITVSRFARKIDKTSQGVYYLIKRKELDTEKIDGFLFIILNQKAKKLLK